jgi:hypothetical protein
MTELRKTQIRRSAALVALGVAYLAIVAAMFILNIDAAASAAFQYAAHVVTMASAIAYVLFAEAIYREDAQARMAFVFSAMFAVPVMIGRGAGIYAISNGMTDSVYNFYAAASVSRAAEVMSWTTLFPLSMLCLARLFLKKKRRLQGAVCAASAVCCFIGVLSLIFSEAIFSWIGVLGWGALFLIVVLVYLISRAKKTREPRE